MRQTTAILLIGVIFTVGLSLVVGVGVVDVSAADTIVVDQDGTAEYSSIQTAIDDASAGDTVEIRPGTYAETIVVDKNITVTAPDGATLDATNLDASDVGVTIGNDAFDQAENIEPTIRGLTITRYETGIDTKADGAWVISNVTVEIIEADGIDADSANGDWTIRDTKIESTGGLSIIADSANGNWTIRNVSVDDSIRTEGSDGDWIIGQSSVGGQIDASRSNGEWLIQDTVVSNWIRTRPANGDWTIRNVSVDGAIYASGSDGNWVIEQTSVQDGVSAVDSNGKWEITQSVITGDVPISAENTLGEWRVSQSIITQTFDDTTAIDATDAIGEGIATDNWWGSPSGPDENACVGNVDCSDPLTTRPSDVGYNPDDGDESTPTPTPTPIPTPGEVTDATTANPSPSENRGAIAGVTPYTTADDVLGGIGNDAVIFQGEENITFESATGERFNPSELERTAGNNEGLTLTVPMPDNQAEGSYAENPDGSGFSVTVQEPRVTELEIQNNTERDVSGGILELNQNNASVFVEYNYEEAENIELTVESENGLDVTGEALDIGEVDNKNADPATPSGSAPDGSVRFELNPSNLDEGQYTFTVAGVEDLDSGEATQSVTTTISADQTASLSLSEDEAVQGSDTIFTVENSPEGEFHPVVIDESEFRDGVSLDQAEDVFRNVGDTVETGVADSTGPGASDIADVEYAYAIVEIGGGDGVGSIETQFLDDSSATLELYPSDGVTVIESHPASVVLTADNAFETDDEEDLAVVEDDDSESPVDKYDANNDGEISIIELGRAGQAFASGELTITELGEVGAAFAS